MRFNDHGRLTGKHAFLSASSYHWINYDNDKLIARLKSSQAAKRGSEEHAFAAEAIRLGHRLAGNKTITKYVNDAIGYKMKPEQVLYVSDNCFGTADAIVFRDGKLRVHDLKTGDTPASEHQLEVYAAMFCLEYNFKPFEIEMELRIYQGNERLAWMADPEIILHIMDKIKAFDRIIDKKLQEELA